MTDHRTHPTRPDFRFWWPVTVRWGDMDAMGHINNVVHFQYLESVRIGFADAIGWGIRTGSGGRQGPAVVSQTYHYRRQVFYPAELEVGVRCREVRGGSSVVVWLDYDGGRAPEIPPDLRQALTGS